MTISKKIILVGFALGFTAPALAQDNLGDYLMEACKDDLEQYCSTVTPGEGRLLHCVAAHEDKLSGQCVYALYQAASLLEELAVTIAYIADSCETEITSMCADVEMGEGRVLNCLAKNEAALGAACKKALADTVAE